MGAFLTTPIKTDAMRHVLRSLAQEGIDLEMDMIDELVSACHLYLAEAFETKQSQRHDRDLIQKLQRQIKRQTEMLESNGLVGRSEHETAEDIATSGLNLRYVRPQVEIEMDGRFAELNHARASGNSTRWTGRGLGRGWNA